jgi:hypothetical protein
MRVFSTVILFLCFISNAVAGIDKDAARDKALAFIEEVKNGQYEKASQGTLAEESPDGAAVLEKWWTAMTTQLGRLERIGAVKVKGGDRDRSVIVKLRFEKGSAPMTISFNEDGKMKDWAMEMPSH